MNFSCVFGPHCTSHHTPLDPAEAHHHLRHEVERILIRAERSGRAADLGAADRDYLPPEARTRPDPPEPSFEDFRPPTGSEPDEPTLF